MSSKIRTLSSKSAIYGLRFTLASIEMILN